MTATTTHFHFMTLALRLAAKGQGKTSPNPMVGSLVVKSGRIVGRGYHQGPGQPHAEILALKQAGPRAKGAILYVTLEPCCHLLKRTPPCVPTVIQSGVRQVVVAMTDPNPLVKGRGVAALRRAGIAVTTGIAQEEAAQLNRAYLHWVTTGHPYVILKAGMTLDGKVATAKGESQWITGPLARREAHRLRSQVDAVIVGVGTVLNPHYSCLMVSGAADAMLEEPMTPLSLSRSLMATAGPYVLCEERSGGRRTSCAGDSGHTSPVGSLSATVLQTY